MAGYISPFIHSDSKVSTLLWRWCDIMSFAVISYCLTVLLLSVPFAAALIVAWGGFPLLRRYHRRLVRLHKRLFPRQYTGLKRPREEDCDMSDRDVIVRPIAPIAYHGVRRIPIHWSVLLSPRTRDLLFRVAHSRGG